MTTNRDASYYTKVTYTGMTEYDFDMRAVWAKIASHERARRIWVEETPDASPGERYYCGGCASEHLLFPGGKNNARAQEVE